MPAPRRAGTTDQFFALATQLERNDPRRCRAILAGMRNAVVRQKKLRRSEKANK